MDVPGSGRMCVALDAAGAAFDVWQAAGAIGIEIYNEPVFALIGPVLPT
jgi:hypothetical protein